MVALIRTVRKLITGEALRQSFGICSAKDIILAVLSRDLMHPGTRNFNNGDLDRDQIWFPAFGMLIKGYKIKQNQIWRLPWVWLPPPPALVTKAIWQTLGRDGKPIWARPPWPVLATAAVIGGEGKGKGLGLKPRIV